MLRSAIRRTHFLVAVLALGTLGRSASAGDAWPHVKARSEREMAIYTKLDEPTRTEFSDTPLTEVLEYLEQLHNVPIELDSKRLENTGVDPSSDTISMDLADVSLRHALRLMLHPLGLTYAVTNDVLLITTDQNPETREVRAYNVTPLSERGRTPQDLTEILNQLMASSDRAPSAAAEAARSESQSGPSRGPYGSQSASRLPKARLQTLSSNELILVKATDSQHQRVAEILRMIYESSQQKPPQEIAGQRTTGERLGPRAAVDSPLQSRKAETSEMKSPTSDDDPFSFQSASGDDPFSGP